VVEAVQEISKSTELMELRIVERVVKVVLVETQLSLVAVLVDRG
jgi:hypothetical protein